MYQEIKNCNGFCDCGDFSMIKEECTCSLHKHELNEKELIDKFPKEIA